MAQTVLIPLLGKEFDRFLYASVGEESNGMALSVLSAFARLGVDPWVETLALSSMPGENARERLAVLFASTTKNLATNLSTESVAARLIALLPVPSKLSIPIAMTGAGTTARPSRIVILLGIVVIVLVSLLIVTDRSRVFGFGPTVSIGEATPSR